MPATSALNNSNSDNYNLHRTLSPKTRIKTPTMMSNQNQVLRIYSLTTKALVKQKQAVSPLKGNNQANH
jgi:hypothetical protein